MRDSSKQAVALFLCGALLSSCASDKDPKKPNSIDSKGLGFGLSESELVHYKSLKKIPEQANIRGNASIVSFVERNALAEVIAGQQWADKSIAEVEAKDKRNQTLISRYFAQFMDGVVTEEAVDQFYRENIDTYKDSKLRIAHILLRIRDERDDKLMANTFNKARSIVDEINSGASFATIAERDSDDRATRGNGGELGWISKGRSVEDAIYQSALKLHVGEVSEPVPSNQGLHLIKLLEEPITETPSLEKIRDKVLYDLKYQLKLDEMNRLKKSAESRLTADLSKFSLN